jgi:hypothetical protein
MKNEIGQLVKKIFKLFNNIQNYCEYEETNNEIEKFVFKELLKHSSRKVDILKERVDCNYIDRDRCSKYNYWIKLVDYNYVIECEYYNETDEQSLINIKKFCKENKLEFADKNLEKELENVKEYCKKNKLKTK